MLFSVFIAYDSCKCSLLRCPAVASGYLCDAICCIPPTGCCCCCWWWWWRWWSLTTGDYVDDDSRRMSELNLTRPAVIEESCDDTSCFILIIHHSITYKILTWRYTLSRKGITHSSVFCIFQILFETISREYRRR